MANDESLPEPAAGVGCPICGAERAPRYRPFCSARCANIDLGRWLNESYAVPVEEELEPDAEQPYAGRPDPDRARD